MPRALRTLGKCSVGLILILLPGRVYGQSATALPSAPNRGVGHTTSRVALDLGNTVLYNAAAEFWPDIHRQLHRIF